MSGLVGRSEMLAFYGVPTTSGGATTITYHRMTKFTAFPISKNPKEYNRNYVDEEHDTTDIVGYSPSINYSFDRYRNNPVHDDIIEIANKELIGDDAVRSIIIVDTKTNEALKRDYSVIPSSEGDNVDVYTYSGDVKCHGALIKGTVTTSDDYQTVVFTEAS